MASEVRVNQIQNRSGLGTVTFSDSGVLIAGVTTVGILSATGNSVFSGSVTATTFSGALTGNATGLSGTPNITVGTISATSLNASGVITATSFSGSGANLTGIGGTTDVRTNSLVVSGMTTATGGLQVGATTSITVGSSFIKNNAVGLGQTTTTGRNAGVGTAVGTIIFNSTTSTLDVYISNAIGWSSIEISPDGTQGHPFGSPVQAQNSGATSGQSYYFKFGSMTSAIQAEYQGSYYESKPWIKVFQSAYTSTATVNLLDNSMPMKGLLVQRNALDIRAAVYWSSPITYNTVGGSGNNTADSGYSPRRVILGFAGGHGIYNTAQNQCSWGDSSGSIGAGYDGGSCGSFPNNLVWGTGQSGNATYANRSGTWSHWIWWEGNN